VGIAANAKIKKGDTKVAFNFFLRFLVGLNTPDCSAIGRQGAKGDFKTIADLIPLS
jgi:hypothetical protein